jgi:hypothetical protein
VAIVHMGVLAIFRVHGHLHVSFSGLHVIVSVVKLDDRYSI